MPACISPTSDVEYNNPLLVDKVVLLRISFDNVWFPEAMGQEFRHVFNTIDVPIFILSRYGIPGAMSYHNSRIIQGVTHANGTSICEAQVWARNAKINVFLNLSADFFTYTGDFPVAVDFDESRPHRQKRRSYRHGFSLG